MINIPEEIKKDILLINQVSNDLKMKLYVVGGFPRDMVMGAPVTNETDLDVTEGNGNAFDLAFFVSAKYNLHEPIVYGSSGTAMVNMASGRTVEFHNAFYNAPHIIDQLYLMGIEPTSINKDIYCRDFTINTLLFDIETGEILDLTKLGIQDIKNKILRTPLPAKKSLEINPKIIIRGIRFKLQFDLKEEEEYAKEVINYIPNLIEWLQQNKNSKFVRNHVGKALEINATKAVEEYSRLGILEYLPSNPDIDNVIKNKMFGTTVNHESFDGNVKTAQTKMMQHMMMEREKHKAYMRRKKREDKQKKMEKFKILDRARSGYYIDNAEPDFVKNRKIDKNRKLFQYITERSF
jgi:tRNA nucleotidyltransferase/poly(A) polymerase